MLLQKGLRKVQSHRSVLQNLQAANLRPKGLAKHMVGERLGESFPTCFSSSWNRPFFSVRCKRPNVAVQGRKTRKTAGVEPWRRVLAFLGRAVECFGWIKQCKCRLILSDFPHNSALFGLVI